MLKTEKKTASYDMKWLNLQQVCSKPFTSVSTG